MLHQRLGQWMDGDVPVLHAWADVPDKLADVGPALAAVAQRVSSDPPVVHVFSPGDLLVLLQRLNALVTASVSQSAAPGHFRQIWVLQNAERMDSANLDILRRICVHYPELGVRLVLLSQATTPPAWPEWPEGVQVLALTDPAKTEKGEDFSFSAAQPRRWGWLALWMFLGALAVAAIYWGQEFADQRPKDSQEAPSGTPPLPQVSAEASATVSEPPALTPSAPNNAETVVQQPQALPSAAAPSAGTSETRKTPQATQPVSASRRWLLGLPSGTLVVVHADLSNLREAEKFRASHELLANARILLTSERQGHPGRFLVVTGPFRSSERVTNYIQRLPWKQQAKGVSRDDLLRQVAQ